ncbi:unnamed protein product, partial [Mesorhabditis spiculigera]
MFRLLSFFGFCLAVVAASCPTVAPDVDLNTNYGPALDGTCFSGSYCRNVNGDDVCFPMSSVCPTFDNVVIDQATVVGYPNASHSCPASTVCLFGSTNGIGYVHLCVTSRPAVATTSAPSTICPGLEAYVVKSAYTGPAFNGICPDAQYCSWEFWGPMAMA